MERSQEDLHHCNSHQRLSARLFVGNTMWPVTLVNPTILQLLFKGTRAHGYTQRKMGRQIN